MQQYSTRISSIRAEQVKAEWFKGDKPTFLDDRVTINHNMMIVVITLGPSSFTSAEIGDWIIIAEDKIRTVSDSAFQLLFELKQDRPLTSCVFEEKGEYCPICDRGAISVGRYLLRSGSVEVTVGGVEKVYKTIDHHWLFRGKDVEVYALDGLMIVPAHWMKMFGVDRPLPIPMLWTGHCPGYDIYVDFSENPGKVLSESLLSMNMSSNTNNNQEEEVL